MPAQGIMVEIGDAEEDADADVDVEVVVVEEEEAVLAHRLQTICKTRKEDTEEWHLQG